MIVLFLSSCIALLFVYYASRDKFPLGLEWAFLVVTFIAAIHYNYGSDYSSYINMFNLFSNIEFSWADLADKKIYKEPGWALLNFIFKPFGFFFMVAFLGVFQNFIYYLFVKRVVPKKWWVMGVFIYLFSDSLWVLNMSMMRQGLAVTLFVLSWIVFDINKKLFPISFIIVLIATTIHSSAMILFPCLLIFYLKKNVAPYLGGGLVFLFILFFLKPEFCNQIFMAFSDVEDIERMLLKYGGTAKSLSYGMGFILILIPFFTMLFFLVKNESLSEREIQCVALAAVAYVIIPFREIIPMVSRLSYYFVAFSIPAIPLVYKNIKFPYRFFWIGAFLLLYVYSYFSFFYSPTWKASYMNFHSIFTEIL